MAFVHRATAGESRKRCSPLTVTSMFRDELKTVAASDRDNRCRLSEAAAGESHGGSVSASAAVTSLKHGQL